MRFLALLLFVLALVLPLSAGERHEVDGKRALETVKTLASDAFGGRKSGLPSGRNAEDWMARQLSAIGLRPGYKGSYFHEFKASVTEDGAGALFQINQRVGSYLTDYVTLIYSGKGAVTSGVVFAGYGIHAPKKGHNDYEGLDVTGKIVMAVRGVPTNSGFEEERYIGYKSSTAFERGASGFLLVEGDKAVPGTIQEKYHRKDLPAVWLSRRAADEILKAAGQKDLANQVAALKKGERRSFALKKVTVKLQIASRLLKDQPMRNVVGLWPGTGPPHIDEYVVLGAHLDHVGTDAADNVYNGADDNASGSSMLLEVARAIVASKQRFKRGIIFCWFAAEEQGLTGSRRFVKDPPIPLDKIAVMFNTDMVGQGKPQLAVGGAELYPRDSKMFGDVWKGTKPFRSAPNSDHHPFQAAGVPAFFIHTVGPHPNYHQPGDDWQAIKPELLELSGRFIRDIAERAAASSDNHCRANRLGEYLWNRAHTFSLSRPLDFRVTWFENDAEPVMNGLAKDWGKNVYKPGVNVDAIANSLDPTRLLGVSGPPAFRLHKPARKLGATIFAPFTGREQPTIDQLKDVGPVIWLKNAPNDPLLLNLEAALLVPEHLALKWKDDLKKRVHSWLVVGGHELRKHFEPTRILLAPTDPQMAKQLLDQGLDRVVIRGMFGENFLALLRKLTP